MKISKSAAYALGICGAAVLVSCSNASGSLGSASAGLSPAQLAAHLLGRPSLLPTSVMQGLTPRPDHRKSWVSPDVKRAPRLLFVSDAQTDDVYILTMPALALKGRLTGFSQPEGMCSDKLGEIWLANVQAGQMVLLSRTGQMIRSLYPPKDPITCAIDPTTGNLAVSEYSYTTNVSDIVIYANASGTPTTYTNPNVSLYNFAGYDPNGDLFVDGYPSGTEGFVLAELPKNGNALRIISISGGTFNYPGSLEWYAPGDYLGIGDSGCGNLRTDCVRWTAISGSVGTILGETDLLKSTGGRTCSSYQQVLTPGAMKIAESDYAGSCGSSSSSTYVWAYPAGGLPVSGNSSVGLAVPVGAAISSKKP